MKAELETLRTTQQAVRDATAELERLQGLRAQQSETAAAINASVATDMGALNKARRDALTAVALGEADNSALAEVENTIADAEARMVTARRAAADAEQAAQGITQRIEAAQAALQEAQSKVSPAHLACLEAHANELGTQYLEQLKRFIELFRRLFALHFIIKAAGGTGTFSPWGVSGMRIPWFMFPAERRQELTDGRRGFIFDNIDMRDSEVEKWLENEREFLKKLKVIG